MNSRAVEITQLSRSLACSKEEIKVLSAHKENCEKAREEKKSLEEKLAALKMKFEASEVLDNKISKESSEVTLKQRSELCQNSRTKGASWINYWVLLKLLDHLSCSPSSVCSCAFFSRTEFFCFCLIGIFEVCSTSPTKN